MARLSRSFLSGLLVLAGLCVLTPARAQLLPGNKVEITEESIRRTEGLHTDIPDQLYWISQSDCVNDDIFTFPVQVTREEVMALEVWVGPSSTDCTNDDARSLSVDSPRDCWRVYSETADSGLSYINVAAREIVAGLGGTADESVCFTSDRPGGEEVKVWFLLMDGVDIAANDSFEMGYDLVGPEAPTEVEGGPAENAVSLTWLLPENASGFRFYCEQVGAATTAPGPTGLRPLAVAGAGGVGGAVAITGGTPAVAGGTAAETGGAAGKAGAAGTAGSSATAGATGRAGATSTEGGASAGPTVADCAAAVNLAAGDMPKPEMFCGEVGNIQTEGIADRLNGGSLTNGALYAVAVAAVDDLGNSGPLSNVVCATPAPVETFFERYAAQGGKGGGGFCAVGSGRTHGIWLCLAGAALMLGIRRRRAS